MQMEVEHATRLTQKRMNNNNNNVGGNKCFQAEGIKRKLRLITEQKTIKSGEASMKLEENCEKKS